jgi:hypothetical protein
VTTLSVRVQPEFGGPWVDAMVELRRVDDTHDGQPRYAVTLFDDLLDGTVIGTVHRGTITVERKSKGQRYVNSRRTSAPRYWFANGDHRLDYTTRLRAVETVVRDHLRTDD